MRRSEKDTFLPKVRSTLGVRENAYRSAEVRRSWNEETDTEIICVCSMIHESRNERKDEQVEKKECEEL